MNALHDRSCPRLSLWFILTGKPASLTCFPGFPQFLPAGSWIVPWLGPSHLFKKFFCHPSIVVLFNTICSCACTNSLSFIQLQTTLLLSIWYIYRPEYQRVVRRYSVAGGNGVHQFHLHVAKCYRKREACVHNVYFLASGILKQV